LIASSNPLNEVRFLKQQTHHHQLLFIISSLTCQNFQVLLSSKTFKYFAKVEDLQLQNELFVVEKPGNSFELIHSM